MILSVWKSTLSWKCSFTRNLINRLIWGLLGSIWKWKRGAEEISHIKTMSVSSAIRGVGISIKKQYLQGGSNVSVWPRVVGCFFIYFLVLLGWFGIFLYLQDKEDYCLYLFSCKESLEYSVFRLRCSPGSPLNWRTGFADIWSFL